MCKPAWHFLTNEKGSMTHQLVPGAPRGPGGFSVTQVTADAACSDPARLCLYVGSAGSSDEHTKEGETWLVIWRVLWFCLKLTILLGLETKEKGKGGQEEEWVRRKEEEVGKGRWRGNLFPDSLPPVKHLWKWEAEAAWSRGQKWSHMGEGPNVAQQNIYPLENADSREIERFMGTCILLNFLLKKYQVDKVKAPVYNII